MIINLYFPEYVLNEVSVVTNQIQTKLNCAETHTWQFKFTRQELV